MTGDDLSRCALAGPECRARMARLVAREFDRHHACLKQRFALEIAGALKELIPPDDDPHAQAVGRGIALSISTLRVLAGLPADTSPAEVRP